MSCFTMNCSECDARTAYREQQRPQRGQTAHGGGERLVVQAGAEGGVDAAQRPALQRQLPQRAAASARSGTWFTWLITVWDRERLGRQMPGASEEETKLDDTRDTHSLPEFRMVRLLMRLFVLSSAWRMLRVCAHGHTMAWRLHVGWMLACVQDSSMCRMAGRT